METEKNPAKTGKGEEVTLMKKPSESSRRRFITKLENGQAKLISREGQIIKVLLNYKGFKLDEKGDVVPLAPGEKDPEKFLGGIEIFSLDPLNYVEIFPWEWDTVDSEGNKKHHKERPVDYIYLIPDVYYSELVARRETNENAAVTKDGATILRVKIGYTMRAKNPVKSRYNITNWTYTAVNDLNNQVRDLIGQYTLNELNSGMGDLGRIFFERIITDKVFRARINGKKIKEDRRFVKEKLDSYGVELSGIQILSIELPEEIKKSLSDPYTAEQTKKKDITESEGKMLAKANEGAGAKEYAFQEAQGELERAKKFSEGERVYIEMLEEKFGPEAALLIYNRVITANSSLSVRLDELHISGMDDAIPSGEDIKKSIKKKIKKEAVEKAVDGKEM